MNISNEVKFVKAKEPIVVGSTVKKANVEKKKNVTDQLVLNKPIINLWSGLKPEKNLLHDRKEVLERTMCVITVDFRGTPDPIVIS